MKKFLTCILFLLISGTMLAQMQGDVLGSHNLSPGGASPVQGKSSAACLYCHAPHSGIGGRTPLWGRTLSSQTYAMYSSTTMQNATTQPLVGGSSSLCLSCHDGTVALGSTVPASNEGISGSMYSKDMFGSQLQSSHPFAIKTPLVDSPDLVSTLASTGKTADPLHKVNLVDSTVECTSCHEPHQQNIDPVSLKFLVRDSVNGQLCLSCHTGDARTVNGKENPLMQWTSSIHALSGNRVTPQASLGSYTTVAQFACLSCHQPHNANGNGGLFRAPVPPAANMDAATQSCMTCHNGGTSLEQPIPNVYAEFSKRGHPFPNGSNTHDANEPAAPVNNRHATCADCHNPHSSFQVAGFNGAPAIRASQTGVVGVSANDGTTVLKPAVNQYESCLRCHGTSPGKQSLQVYGYMPFRAVSAPDRLNIIPEFSATSTSSHPVLRTANSPWPQPSLRSYMLNLDGATNSTRAMKTGRDQLLCTDCHNSDDNREFGGSGPSGPHGSEYDHVLERRYEFSQVAVAGGPGSPIQNVFPNPDLSGGGASPGPYALCAKCHDLSVVLSYASWRGHREHVSDQGVSCSVCHTAHGMGSVSPNISGERLVNFDLSVVAQSGNAPVAYSRATNSCTLTCHGKEHSGSGVRAATTATVTVKTK